MNNLLRRMTALLLLLAMLLPLGVTNAQAAEVTESEETTGTGETSDVMLLPARSETNPLYPELKHEQTADTSDSASAETAAATVYHSTVAAAGKDIANQMKKRTSTIVVGIKVPDYDYDYWYDLYDLMLNAAFVHTGVPTEGDYIRFQWRRWEGTCQYQSTDSGYLLTYTYNMTYMNTAAQEAQMDPAVDALLDELDLDGKTDYQKIYAIYDWICTNVRYDYDNLHNSSYTQKWSAWAALIDRTAVCQGYAVLFYRLCLEVGVNTRCVLSIEEENHIWNIVKLGTKYYNLDATWDEGQPSYSWFLLNQADFVRHTRDAEYTTSTFCSKYPMHEKSFDPSDYAVTVPATPYKVANTVSGVHVYWNKVANAQKYGVWRSENGVNGTYKWIANPTTNHFTDTNVTSGKTYHYKITAVDPLTGEHTAKSGNISIIYVSTPDITARYNKAAGIKLEWQKIPGATGYAVYRKSYSGSDAWVRVATVSGGSTLSWTDTSVKDENGTAYKYTVRALAGKSMKILSGCRNNGRTMVRLTSQTLTSAAKASSTSIKCSWTTSGKVTGYEIRFVVDGEVYKTFAVGSYKTGTKTFTGLKAGQTYKIQVRTYKKIAGVGTFYSAWSEGKTVKL